MEKDIKTDKTMSEVEYIIKKINDWQSNTRLHPMTCGNNSEHRPLYAAEFEGKVFLLCHDCDYKQKHIPEVVVNAQPPVESGSKPDFTKKILDAAYQCLQWKDGEVTGYNPQPLESALADVTSEPVKWIPVSERVPTQYQKVAFVIDNPGSDRHEEVYGGTYQGDRWGYHEFTTPGCAFKGSHWMPLPNPPEK